MDRRPLIALTIVRAVLSSAGAFALGRTLAARMGSATKRSAAVALKASWISCCFGILFVVGIAVTGCGGGGSSGAQPVTYSAASGLAQKGPLIKGSTVTAQELNANLSPTGEQFSYQITSDLGAFEPTSTFNSQYIGLSATGYYFDEVQNALSSGTVTLTGYSDLALDQVLNVNLLTTLAYQRIQTLVTSGMTFAAARTQAETEVLAALNIPAGSYGSFGTLDLSGDSDGDHILTAVSGLFVYGNSAGPLSQLIANFQSDLGANGVITNPATKAALIASAEAVNPTAVAANLTTEYASAGVAFTASNISEWIAQSGDGVIGKFSFQVPDATPSSAFTFPSSVVAQFAGTSVSVSKGQLSVNGAAVSGAVSFNAGDVVTLVPGSGMFPNGVFISYLVSGSTNLIKVSFVSGLLSIAITPAAASLPVGLTQQFKAIGTFSDTSTADLTNSLNWTSGTATTATIGATSGLATALAVGSTLITATSGSVAGSTTLNVTAAALESIAITPNPAYAGVGSATQLTATGTYSDGTTQNVTTTAIWTSGTPAVATVGPTTGLATGVSLGSVSISAVMGPVGGTASLLVVSGVWTPTGSMSTPRVDHTATLLLNGTVLVVGGSNAGTALASAEIYDPIAGTWTATGSLTSARSLHTATLLPSGKVLVAGGATVAGPLTPSVPLASAELYDPATGAWTTTGSLAVARGGQTATLLTSGKVLVAGGYNQVPLNSAELYDPAAGTWSATGSLVALGYPQGIDGQTATLLPDGTVLVAGGDDAVELAAFIYSPVTGAWNMTGSLAFPTQNHTATLLSSGSVLAAGGFGETATMTTAEVYDPVSGTWQVTGSLATSRDFHTATLLPNGWVLVAGGATNTGLDDAPVSLASAEIYNPVAGTWSSSGSLTTARQEHTATLLPNGSVLVTGGATQANALASAEIYY
jgi:hypothetical protein